MNIIPEYEPYYPVFEGDMEDTTVQLNSLVNLVRDENNTIIAFDCWWRTIYYDKDNHKIVTLILNALKGEMSLEDICSLSGISRTVTLPILQSLYEVGVVLIRECRGVPALSFFRHAVASMRSKRHKMVQENPLVSIANPETLSRRLLLALLVEGYHFSSSASSHISLAISQARDKKVEEVLSAYLSDEYWHGKSLGSGLVKAGISKEDLRRSSPTFPLLGIINFLRHIARTDLEAYGVCLALTESNTSNAFLVDKQEVWEFIRTLELIPDEALDAFCDHAEMDYESKHDMIPEIIFRANNSISSERQKEILHTAALYIEMIGDYYTYLKRYYASPNGKSYFEVS